jgi:hypothetical protein
MKTSNLAECFPAMTRLIVRWVAATLPATEACTARDDVAHQDISSLTHSEMERFVTATPRPRRCLPTTTEALGAFPFSSLQVH